MIAARTPAGARRQRRRLGASILTAAVLLAALATPDPAGAARSPSPSSASTSSAAGILSPAATVRRFRQVSPAVDPATGLQPGVRRLCPARPGRVQCLAVQRVAAASTHPDRPDGTSPVSGYTPAQLQDAYNLPSATAGAGQTVAIVDAYDDPNAETDLRVYRSTFGLPACSTANGCFRKVNQSGATGSYPPPETSGEWGEETSLDVDMVSAICPRCHILLVEANNDNTLADLAAGVDTAVRLGAKFVSNSYGESEYESGSQNALNAHYHHPGVAITVSSGDSSYGSEFPASAPTVVAVGGTSLLTSANQRGWAEIAWTGTGSGCSPYEAKPSWQNVAGCSRRVANDVSAVADPYTGVRIYDTYAIKSKGWISGVGGTSVSSPIIAATFALAGTPKNYLPAYGLSTHHTQLNDIVAGTNSAPACPPVLCIAQVGYDGPTGWGTPNGVGAFVPTTSPAS